MESNFNKLKCWNKTFRNVPADRLAGLLQQHLFLEGGCALDHASVSEDKKFKTGKKPETKETLLDNPSQSHHKPLEMDR
jgi:hypothetical protein